MSIQLNQKVRHNLTGEEALVITVGLIGVRLPNMETAIVNEEEVEVVEAKE
jgi:hypothetical protein